jgi:hypothetical protein
MILRPVRPQSPSGPPITNLPVGLIKYSVVGQQLRFGSTFLITFSIMNFSISAC